MIDPQLSDILAKHPYLEEVSNRINSELVPLLKSQQITQDEFEDLAQDYVDEINLDVLLKTAELKAKAVEAVKMLIELAKMAS